MIPTRPSISTISRWCSTGVRGLKLESIRIGGKRRTTKQAVERLLIACAERDFAGMDGDISRLREYVKQLDGAHDATGDGCRHGGSLELPALGGSQH
jgi:hypothetical protein